MKIEGSPVAQLNMSVLAADPVNAGVLYAGTSVDGLWKVEAGAGGGSIFLPLMRSTP